MIKTMPPGFFDSNGQPNDAFVDWLEPLLGEIPEIGTKEWKKVAKLLPPWDGK